jgi:hypothetical protein
MRWVATSSLREWAKTRDSQGVMPELIRKLIRATCNGIKAIHFPSGENVQLGGWDGVLELIEGNEYLPVGISLWEIGCDDKVRSKADRDYAKRSEDPLGYDKSDSTYIFLTPRLFRDKNKWIDEKKRENIWKDVRVIDATILEEWLEQVPAIAAWLSTKKTQDFPSGKLESPERYWDKWSVGPDNVKLLPELLLGGRSAQKEQLLERAHSSSLIVVEGASEEEALAFIISCFKTSTEYGDSFLSKGIIVYDQEIYESLTESKNRLIIIPHFGNSKNHSFALSKNHTVILPVGADSLRRDENKITLPRIDRETFINSLVASGIDLDVATNYSRETTRNIQILRRQLKFDINRPHWTSPDIFRKLIPAILLNKWQDNLTGDRELISKVSKKEYDEAIRDFRLVTANLESPIIKIGELWRLVSPLDTWVHMMDKLSRDDWKMFESIALEVLSEIDPNFEDNAIKEGFISYRMRYSRQLREGVVQSLILVAIYGDELGVDLPLSSQNWVDRILYQVLEDKGTNFWKSIDHILPLLAEASPTVFLDAVKKGIEIENPPILGLFEEEKAFLSGYNYYHTGLLWALECLAWEPNLLSRVSLILQSLIRLAPDVNLMNKPINSCKEIFCYWHPQTFSSITDREQILRLLFKRDYDSAWRILMSFLPSAHPIAHGTYKPRWRSFNQSTLEESFLDESYIKMPRIYAQLIMDFFRREEQQLVDVVRRLPEFEDISIQHDVLNHMLNIAGRIEQKTYEAWDTLRGLIHRHRSHPDRDWSLPEALIQQYENLYNNLAPGDELKRELWLFDKHWEIENLEGFDYRTHNHDQIGELSKKKRLDFLSKLYLEQGITTVLEIVNQVKESQVLGFAASLVINKEKDVSAALEIFSNGEKERRFVGEFFYRISINQGIQWALNKFLKIDRSKFTHEDEAGLLSTLPHTQEVWEFLDTIDVEVKDLYWKRIIPRIWLVDDYPFLIRKLLDYHRYYTVIDCINYNLDKISPELKIEILYGLAKNKDEVNASIDHYDIGRIFEDLDKSVGVAKEQLIKLEWIHYQYLQHTNRGPKLLWDQLAEDPIFFADMIKLSDFNSLDNTEPNSLENNHEFIQKLQAHQLIRNWDKIPGFSPSNNLDDAKLENWVRTVREMLSGTNLLKSADDRIGKMLAGYPEDGGAWPPLPICEILESINTREILEGFRCEVFNKRGSSSRSPFAGGQIERNKASYFKRLASEKINLYPVVANIFEGLAEGYEEDAKREDDRAARDAFDY